MRRAVTMLSIGLVLLSADAAFSQNSRPHNVILFVPDGLRGRIVSPETAPAMAEVRDRGVNFKNSHSMFPTFTTANASAMATGHYLGDTGDFSNTIYTGYPVGAAGGTVTPFLEVNTVIADVVEMSGTLRAFDPIVREASETRIRRIVEGVAQAYNVRAELRVVRGYPPVVNDAKLAENFGEHSHADAVPGPGSPRSRPPCRNSSGDGSRNK